MHNVGYCYLNKKDFTEERDKYLEVEKERKIDKEREVKRQRQGEKERKFEQNCNKLCPSILHPFQCQYTTAVNQK